ncbi:hypothetical protein EVAR_28268_1 [Eumeta japonica]|uniref:Uncharacterized protein n=1 Tax=Eumeta variegata TaxID=151549 RepID=A0A4C1V5M9_EUMVA|nr:hypothetical protein EVAR_28268_1 [Eumeta japonica]
MLTNVLCLRNEAGPAYVPSGRCVTYPPVATVQSSEGERVLGDKYKAQLVKVGRLVIRNHRGRQLAPRDRRDHIRLWANMMKSIELRNNKKCIEFTWVVLDAFP